jgi:hypothetical protein
MAWLLDTNILSEIRRERPEPKVLAFIERTPLNELFVSAVTLAELRFGIFRLSTPQQGEKAKALTRWLDDILRPLFNNRILQVTENVMFRWRVLMDDGRKSGHTYSQPDLIIAATALEYGFTVVTRDRRGFEKTGARVLNPWENR